MQIIDFFGLEQTMSFELIRVLIALAGTAIGTYYDLFNKKNVPEKFLYLFVAVAFLINIFDPNILIYSAVIGIIVFVAFYILYKLGQVGGADGYIMTAIALALPVQPKIFLIFEGINLLPFIFNVFVISGLSFIFYVLIKSIPIVLKNFKLNKQNLIGVLLIAGIYLFFLFLLINSQAIIFFDIGRYIIFITFLMLFLMYYTLFKETINESMIEFVEPKKVEIEDILAIEKMDKNLVQKYGLSRLVTKEMYERIKKIKGKKIAVYKHLPPFVPHILIGLIAAILIGDLTQLLIGL
jgi:Flp pilus assembly protein protease CpaA